MCTVTYLPKAQGAILSSSRDEKRQRGPALPPATYTHAGIRLVYPRDPDATGTWVALHQNGWMAVLLNGGLVKHEPEYPYRKSRGLAFLDIVASDNMVDAYDRTELTGIEPFTLVLLQDGILQENRWDGRHKHRSEKDPGVPHIWSSVTLYDPETIQLRETWFREWLLLHPDHGAADITDFHRFGGSHDKHNGIRMNRGGQMLTVSITCLEQHAGFSTMTYHDLLAHKTYRESIHFQNVTGTPA